MTEWIVMHESKLITSVTGPFDDKGLANEFRLEVEEFFGLTFSLVPTEKINQWGDVKGITKLSLILGGKNEES